MNPRFSDISVNDLPLGLANYDEREREREIPNGCSSIGKVAQWRPGGHGFNPYIPQWHLVN